MRWKSDKLCVRESAIKIQNTLNRLKPELTRLSVNNPPLCLSTSFNTTSEILGRESFVAEIVSGPVARVIRVGY